MLRVGQTSRKTITQQSCGPAQRSSHRIGKRTQQQINKKKPRLSVKYLQGTKLRLPLPSHSRASFGSLRSPAHPVVRSHSATGKLPGPVARSSSTLKVPPIPTQTPIRTIPSDRVHYTTHRIVYHWTMYNTLNGHILCTIGPCTIH